MNHLPKNSCFLFSKHSNSICFEHNFVLLLKVYRNFHRVCFNSVMSILLGLKPSTASKNMFIQLTDIFLCVVYIKHIHDFPMTFDFTVSVASLLFETIKTSLFLPAWQITNIFSAPVCAFMSSEERKFHEIKLFTFLKCYIC